MIDYKTELHRVCQSLPVLDVKELYISHAKLWFSGNQKLCIISGNPFTNGIEFERCYQTDEYVYPHFLWGVRLGESGLAHIELAGGQSYWVRYPISLLTRVNHHNCMNGPRWVAELERLIKGERYAP